MASNLKQQGDTVTLIAPYDVDSGNGLLVGGIFGVALADALEDAEVEVKRSGVWTLTKVSAQAWTLGQRLYWDDTEKKCTTTADGNTQIGAAAAVAANPSATGDVLLIPDVASASFTEADHIVHLTDNTGGSGTHDDTLADGTTIGAALTDSTGGSAGDTLAAIVRAAGIHTWAGGAAATDSIAVTGLVATDLVFVNLMVRGSGNPTSVIGVNDDGNDQIDLLMDQNGQDTVTKIAYLVLITDPKAKIHDAVASLAAKINTLRTDNIVQNQNDSDLGQKIEEILDNLEAANVMASS